MTTWLSEHIACQVPLQWLVWAKVGDTMVSASFLIMVLANRSGCQQGVTGAKVELQVLSGHTAYKAVEAKKQLWHLRR